MIRGGTLFALLAVGCDCGALSHHAPDETTLDGGPCVALPDEAGCPCAIGTYVCYDGPAETAGVGVCRPGVQDCPDGQLRACEGQLLPSGEACNGLDDDCDGEIDDGTCHHACAGVGCGGFGELSEGFQLAEDGALALSLPADDPDAVLWVPEQQARTLAKVDTRRREVVARYRLSPGCPEETTIRIAEITVDADANAFVGMFERDGPSFIVAVSNHCVDRDGDGVVETSTGPDDVRPYFEDECVEWTVETPQASPIAIERLARGVGPDPLLWSGEREGNRVFGIDPRSGELTGDEIVVDPEGAFGGGVTPNHLGFDGEGRLYVSTASQWIAVVESATGEVTRVEAPLQWIGEPLSQDTEGSLWFGGRLQSYDPDHEEWSYPDAYRFGNPTSFYDVVVAPTGIFYGIGEGGLVTYDPESDELDGSIDDDLHGYSLALDRDGFVWEVEGPWALECFEDVCCDLADTPTGAWVRDPWTGDRDLAIDGALHLGAIFGNATGVEPSDVSTQPRSMVLTLEGCPGAQWTDLAWQTRVPDHTNVTFDVQASDAPVPGAAWARAAADPPGSTPTSLVEVVADPARYLHVRVTLSANDGGLRPDLRRTAELIRVEAGYGCR